jgi:4-amino-4-deoxy-L-arabinose transferase-like glycosyltransferase
MLIWLAQSDKMRQRNIYKHFVLVVGIASFLVAPLAWSITPVLYGAGNPSFPFAGPDLNPQLKQLNTMGAMPNLSGMFMGDNTSKLEAFLETHRNGEQYLVAVPNAHLAAPIILDTGEPVITYGGFMGSEKILEPEKLQELVENGKLRYIIIGSAYSQQPEIDSWVRSHGILVPEADWQAAEQVNGLGDSKQMIMKLYECHP